MKRAYLWAALLLIPLSAAGAQRPDSAQRADSLRQRIEERFASRVQERLGLTNDQAAKLRATSREFDAKRRERATRERAIRDAMAAQLQPGTAANQDSVAKLTDALIQLRMAEAQAARDEVKEQSKYLNPVQRARLYAMRERFAHRIREVHGHRRGHGDMGWMKERRKPWL
jgi:murein DD-endopeptidase MepM/ murein hydrolase activator NlpD